MDHDEREAYQTKIDYWRNRAEELEKLADVRHQLLEIYRDAVRQLHRLDRSDDYES